MSLAQPNIPALPSSVDPAIRRAFDALRSWGAEVAKGVDAAILAGTAIHSATKAVADTLPVVPDGLGVIVNTDSPAMFGGYSPTIPTGVVATGAFRTIMIEWDRAGAVFSYAEVWRSTTNSLPTAKMIGTTVATVYTDSPPVATVATTYYYWVRFVGVYGGIGEFSSVVSAHTANDPAYVLELLKGQLGYGDFAAGVYPVRVAETLPELPATLYPQGTMVFLTTDNQLYRSTGTTWTATLPAANIAGTITSTQIADGSISTPKLVTGAVTANEIAANAVTATKLLAGAVTAGKIATGAIVAGDGVIANAAIASAHIIIGSITNALIGSLAVDSAKIASGAIINAKIGTAAVDTLQIAGYAVTVPLYNSFATVVMSPSDDALRIMTTYSGINLSATTNNAAYFIGILKLWNAGASTTVTVSILYNTTGSTTVGSVHTPTYGTIDLEPGQTIYYPVSAIVSGLNAGTYYFTVRFTRSALVAMTYSGNCVLMGAKR